MFPDAVFGELDWWEVLCDGIHLSRARASDLERSISSSSCSLYRPCCRNSRSTSLLMTFVSASAICAADGTHRIRTPLSKCSRINLACNRVRNSPHAGGAVRLMRSNNDLQSVATMCFCLESVLRNKSWTFWGHVVVPGSSPADGGSAEKAGGSFSKVSSALRQSHWGSTMDAQNNQVHERMSMAPASAIDSADRVLTATFEFSLSATWWD